MVVRTMRTSSAQVDVATYISQCIPSTTCIASPHLHPWTSCNANVFSSRPDCLPPSHTQDNQCSSARAHKGRRAVDTTITCAPSHHQLTTHVSTEKKINAPVITKQRTRKGLLHLSVRMQGEREKARTAADGVPAGLAASGWIKCM